MKINSKYKKLFKEGHLNEEGISLYADALILDMKEKIPVEILNHVEECRLCKSEIIELYELCKNNSYPVTNRYPFFHETPNKKINYSALIKIAASVIIILSIGLAVRYVLKDRMKNTGISKEQLHDTTLYKSNETFRDDYTKSSDTVGTNRTSNKKTDIPDDQISESDKAYIAANFEINPVFENLVEVSSRSDILIKITSPKPGQQFPVNKPIIFRWENVSIENLTIKIINNKADKISEIQNITDNSAIFKKELQPGLYYWKIESDKDLIYIGKFIVK